MYCDVGVDDDGRPCLPHSLDNHTDTVDQTSLTMCATVAIYHSSLSSSNFSRPPLLTSAPSSPFSETRIIFGRLMGSAACQPHILSSDRARITGRDLFGCR